MGPITEDVLQECFYPGTFARERDKWKVITEHGRVFVFDDTRFDLSQCLTPLVPGETEESREEMLYGACYFCHLVWGCVDVRSLGLIWRWKIAGYATSYKFTVDDNALRRFGISDAKAVFGETATVLNNWFPTGWRITVPGIGFVVIGVSGGELVVKQIDGDLYKDTLRFLEHIQGHTVVRGKYDFCLTWVVHGETLGFRVIPEIPRGLFSTYLMSQVVVMPIVGLGFLVSTAFPEVKVWQVVVGGWLLSSLFMNLLLGNDRKRGKTLTNQFPQMQARAANADEAKARGML